MVYAIHMWAAYVVVFVLGFSADLLTVEWHRAREAMQINRAAALSMALEALTWAPVMLFVVADDPMVAVVSIVASGAGTRSGLRRIARQDSNAIVDPSVGSQTSSGPPPLQNSLGGEGPPTEPGTIPGFIRRVE